MAVSLRKAINDKCRDCAYDPLDDGTWLKQVEGCLIIDCPLYPARPLTKSGKLERDRLRVSKTRDKGRFK